MAAESIPLVFRDARRGEVPAIIRLLADDPLGRTREAAEDWENPAYYRAFDAIDADPSNRLIVAESEGRLIGCLQLTLIPNLTFKGGTRLHIEGVRVDAAFRSHGVGAAMIEWAVVFGRENACRLVQLDCNASRRDAHRFYESLGFEPTHIGYKCYL